MYYVEISLQLFASAENLLGQNVSRDSLAGMYLYWVIQVGNHEDLFINPETLLKKNSLLWSANSEATFWAQGLCPHIKTLGIRLKVKFDQDSGYLLWMQQRLADPRAAS